MNIFNDPCIIEVELWVNAKHWDPETRKPWFDPPGDWCWDPVTIFIHPTNIYMDWGGQLCLTGTTTSVHF